MQPQELETQKHLQVKFQKFQIAENKLYYVSQL
jgi:hypothetical protein